MRVPGQQRFIPFAQKEINFEFLGESMKFFNQRCGQHHVPDKSRLNDENFLQCYFLDVGARIARSRSLNRFGDLSAHKRILHAFHNDHFCLCGSLPDGFGLGIRR